MDMTRKSFLGVAATAVCAGAFGGAARALAGEEGLLRPPMVPDKVAFNAQCIRCYRCISVCPTGALAPATFNDGILAAKTPKLMFTKGYCDFCNKCVDVCPTEAIIACDPEDPAKGRIGYAVVQKDRCLAYYEGCTVCVDACPYKAISLDANKHPVVDRDACNGCGMCENICPSAVYRTFSGDRRGIVVVPNEAAEQRLAESVEG